MKRDALAFLDYVRAACEAAGVKLQLVARVHTKAGDSGVFDDIKRILTVCVNDEKWLTTLAHEFAHLLQWKENVPVWKTGSTALEDFDGWLRGARRFPHQRLTRMVREIQRCELDAERRALRLIRRFHLTTDIDAYTKHANFYVWQHEAARRLGRWIEVHDQLVIKMPDKLMAKSQIGKLPQDFGMLG